MSEEQPVFKVTDRRLFNPDGTPREAHREEEAPKKTDASTSSASQATRATESTSAQDTTSSSGTTGATNANNTAAANASSAPTSPSQGGEATQRVESSAANSSAAPTMSTGFDDLPEEDAYAEGDIPGADDPTSFINFLMSIASNAAAALGMMAHPVTGEQSVDLQLGKHWIDILGMLQQKTRGNLVPQEQQIFEGLLADLRMQFVSLTNTAPPKAPRGFTGRDIIGGR